MLTMKQRLAKLRSLCKQHDRCKNPRKERSLEIRVWDAFLSIIESAKFPGVRWDVVSWESRPGFSKYARWKMTISASLRSPRGDIAAIREARNIFAPDWREMRVPLTDTIYVDLGYTISVSFTSKSDARRFIARREIRLALDSYEEQIARQRETLDTDLRETRKLVRFMNRGTDD